MKRVVLGGQVKNGDGVVLLEGLAWWLGEPGLAFDYFSIEKE